MFSLQRPQVWAHQAVCMTEPCITFLKEPELYLVEKTSVPHWMSKCYTLPAWDKALYKSMMEVCEGSKLQHTRVTNAVVLQKLQCIHCESLLA